MPRRRSPLPGAGDVDVAIERHLAEFDRLPLAHRNAIATIARVAAELDSARLMALLGVAQKLREAQREDTR